MVSRINCHYCLEDFYSKLCIICNQDHQICNTCSILDEEISENIWKQRHAIYCSGLTCKVCSQHQRHVVVRLTQCEKCQEYLFPKGRCHQFHEDSWNCERCHRCVDNRYHDPKEYQCSGCNKIICRSC